MSLTEERQAQLVASAKKLIGKPYSLFPCGVLIKKIYASTGINLGPPCCELLFLNHKIIPVRKLQKGDLIFFWPNAGRPNCRLATHVAMYIGDGKVIHSNKKHGVSEKKLSEFKMQIIQKKDKAIIKQWLKEVLARTPT